MTESVLERFTEVLARGDRRAAMQLAVELMEGGMALGDLVLGVLAPAQAEVGRRWQRGAITPAQEAVATEIAEVVLAIAAARAASGSGDGRLVMCVAEREHHNLPARMVAEVLRCDGHHVAFVGSPRRGEGVAGVLRSMQADALLVSCSLPMNLPGVLPLVAAAHEAGVHVIAGGRGFGTDALRASALGADAWASSVRDVAAAVERFRGERPALATVRADTAAHAELAAARAPMATELADRVAYRLGHLGVGTDPRAGAGLSDDLRNLLHFLEAAVLCDERILVDYAQWLQERHRLAGADPGLVPAVLRLVEERVALDLPPAAAPLRAARQALLVAA